MPRRSRSLTLGVIQVVAGCAAGTASSPEPTAVQRGALARVHSCAELEQLVKTDARAKMNARIDAQIAQTRQWGQAPVPYEKYAAGAASPSSAPTDPSSRARDYSETNTQVQGVDEADVVETDGKLVYFLHGSTFVALDAWPPGTLTITGSLALEGEPIEMFVAGDDAVVFSIVDGSPIYAAAGVAPRAEYVDGYSYGGPIAVPPIAPGGLVPGFAYTSTPLTKATVLRVTGGAPSLARELYFEGSYLSSRRVGSRVRAVVQGGVHGPSLRYWPSAPVAPTTVDGWVAALEALRRENAAAIDASAARDWLPYAFERRGDAVVSSSMACADLYVPSEASTEYGLTTITSIDLSAPSAAPTETGVLARVDVVYANEAKMILAARSWTAPDVAVLASAPTSGSGGGGGGPVRALDEPPSSLVTLDSTHLHAFDLLADPRAPAYLGSGTVAGTVGGQYAIDERGGLVRVATTENRTASGRWETSTANHVYVLGLEGDRLATKGDAGEIAPGERIYATRFVGDTGYVVTFRQVDPLFVVDLRDASRPRVVGSVTIPGFSTYMHPVDESHLLTIGADGGRLALQIFDVGAPSAPALAHKLVFDGGEYGYSTAQYDPKAFTYFASRGVLGFPFAAWAGGSMRSSLELVSVDLRAGLSRLGSIDHTAFFATAPHGYCGGFFGAEVRRGVFLEDHVVSISYGGVLATSLADLAHPIAALELPAPVTPGTFYGAPCAM